MRKLSPTSLASVVLVVLSFEGGQSFDVPLEDLNIYKQDYIIRPGMGAHKLFKHKVTWDEARQICVREGGHLPLIDSAEKEVVFRKWMTNEMVLDVWLGVHDQYKEGRWVTLTGERLDTMSYSPWAPGEPNDANGGEDCGVLSKIPYGGINDFSCMGRFPYICEIDL